MLIKFSVKLVFLSFFFFVLNNNNKKKTLKGAEHGKVQGRLRLVEIELNPGAASPWHSRKTGRVQM